MRSCGPCTECCTRLEIKTLDKPAGVSCKHLDGNCSIYAERPEVCRNFTCTWLHGQMGAMDRPDKVNTVVWAAYDGPLTLFISGSSKKVRKWAKKEPYPCRILTKGP